MEKKKNKNLEIRAPKTLHGKRARMIRGDVEVCGVLMSNDHQISSDNLVFQFKDENGNKCVSPISKEEYESIEDYLMDF